MDNKTFYILFSEAIEDSDRDVFVSDWALSSVFPEESDPGENAEICGKIWDAAHLSVKEMRERAGMTQAQFAERFCIPKRTIENWEGGSRQAPDYVRLMMARELGLAQGFPEALPVIAVPHMSGWEELGEDAEFIYRESTYIFCGFKIDDKHAALINAQGKFIIAKAFKNCLSIGSGFISEYATYEEARTKIKGAETMENRREAINTDAERIRRELLDLGFNFALIAAMSNTELSGAAKIEDEDKLREYMGFFAKKYDI